MRKRLIYACLITLLFLGVVAGPLPQAAAHEDDDFEEFQYLIGTGIICGLADDACPVIAGMANGDTLEITGSGTFSTDDDNEITGGGTLVHKNADGDFVSSATWTAVKLRHFKSYGSGSAQGLPPEFWGGLATIVVHIVPDGAPTGTVFTGILKVDCTLGDRIPASAHEGATLKVPGLVNFNAKISGLTLFIGLDDDNGDGDDDGDD